MHEAFKLLAVPERSADNGIQVVLKLPVPKVAQRQTPQKSGNIKGRLYLPESFLGIPSKDRARGQTEDHRTHDFINVRGGLGAELGAAWKLVIEFPHHEIIRMFIHGMVRFVEHEQADIASKQDVAMAERVEEHVGRAHYDAVLNQHTQPELPILPLVRLVLARNEPDRDGDTRLDDFLLLPRERDGRRDEPGDLSGRVGIGDGNAARETTRTHTLDDLRSISCFRRRTAI